jgi:hypothetical protein
MRLVRLFYWIVVMPPLVGCAVQESHLATQAEHNVIGISRSDLDMCAGLPTKTEHIDRTTEMRSYERTEGTNSGVTLTLPVIGDGVNFGNGGYCHATFKLVNGRVTELRYAGDTAVAGAPDAICAPIVRGCVVHATPVSATPSGAQMLGGH